jgi:hypothetical protein
MSAPAVFIGQGEHHVGEPFPEAVVVAELLVQLGAVGQDVVHDPAKGVVVLDPRVLLVGMLLRVLISRVRGDLGRDFFADDPALVGVLPFDVAEMVVEGPQDVAEPVQFRLGLATSAAERYLFQCGVGIG